MKKVILLILMLSLMLSVSASAANQDTVYTVDIRNWVRDFLDDQAGIYWTDVIVDRFINLACREVAAYGFIEGIDSVAIVGLTRRYPLPSDFISTRRVTVKHPDTGNRERTMLQRAFGREQPGLQVFGSDNPVDYPQYWSVVRDGKDTTFLMVDPPPAVSPSDSYIFVYYRAQANELTGDSIITNVPYEAIPLVVLSTVRNCLIMNREDQTNQLMIPEVSKMYQTFFALILAQKSDADYIPHQTSP